MTKQTVNSRSAYRGWMGACLMVGILLISGKARADYNIKATEASQTTLVTDGKCNLTEAIASVNAGSAMYGCTGTGMKIVLEGTGAHYKVPQAGVTIAQSGVEITSKVANVDFIEGNVDQPVIQVQVARSLTLTGLTIQRTGTFKAQVLNNQGTLIVNNCVVQNGDATLEGGGIYNNGDLRLGPGTKVQNNKTGKNGGGIYSQNSIGVTINNSTVSGNQSAFSGAGLYSNGSPVTVTSSTFSNNTSFSNAGALYNANGTMSLTQVTIQSNSAIKNGGAIYNWLGPLTMTDSKVTGTHTAANGGGIFNNNATMKLIRSTVEGASASTDGGGIYTQGYNELNLNQTTVQNNKATGNGGGVYSSATLGLYFDSSTISNNTANLKGGGIYSSSRCLGKHSTISTNTATGVGGGVYSTVGDNEYLELSWTTVGYNKGAQGAGVYLDGHADTQTRSSIIAKNQLPNGTFEDYYGNPHGQDGDQAEYKSVFGECTNTMCRPYDIVHNSRILPLANNGGLTKTHEIPADSTALNAFVGVPTWTCPATDQRGRPRPVGSACDLGSYERQ